MKRIWCAIVWGWHKVNLFGEWSADILTTALGTWTFLIIQSYLIDIWIRHHGLPSWTPHILIVKDNLGLTILNLCMSVQAAEAVPLVLMSNNRKARIDAKHREEQAKKDRAVWDHLVAMAERQFQAEGSRLRDTEMILSEVRMVREAVCPGEPPAGPEVSA